jgi:glycosyltransferase involved in cell wall biosynthesis
MSQNLSSTALAPLRIAQIAPPVERVPPAGYGGTERVIDELARELSRRGHDVTLFAAADSTSPVRIVPTVRVALRALGDERDQSPAFVVTLVRALRHQAEFDILHAHLDPWNLPLACGATTPVVATFHGRIDRKGFGAELSDSPARLVAISAAQAQQPDPPIRDWVHNGLSLERMPFGAAGGSDLVFIGRFTADKGVDDAIEVARRTGRRLRIIAKRPYLAIEHDYYDGVVRPLLDTADVEELGELGEDDRDRVLAESYALVMPSVWPEPFGLTAIEAMATGTPVIARAVGALPEIVRHGRDGFLAQDAAGMAAHVHAVAGLDRAAIRRNVIERFSAARMADGYERIYRAVLEERHADAGMSSSPMIDR